MTSPTPHLILNVDDEEGARYAKTKTLERAGFRVLEAGTGTAALRLVQECRPQLVLLDVGLPDVSGLEVCRQIKANVTTSHIMVMQISASCIKPHDRARGLTGGADVYLTEPLESTELIGSAKALLRLYDREEETRVLLTERTERERFIKSLMDATPSLVCLYDLREQRNIYSNAPADSALKHLVEGLQTQGRNALTQLVHVDDFPHLLNCTERLPSMRDGEVLEFECRLRSQDWRWISLRLVVFARDTEGRPTQVLGTAQDITERKLNEQARREGAAELLRVEQRWTAELELKVSERTAELIHSRERLRALASELTLAKQRERQRLATELHDYLAQLLVFGRLKLGQAKRDLKNSWTGSLPEELDDVLDKSLTYVRSLVADLSPPVLREFGLATALEWLAQQMTRQELTVTVNCDLKSSVIPEDQAVLLFQSSRELLINVLKHAGTSHASISAGIKGSTLHLCIADNGVGFDEAATLTGAKSATFGLFSIRERMEDLGGEMTIESALGQGTTVTLKVPLGKPSTSHDHEPIAQSGRTGTFLKHSVADVTQSENVVRGITPSRLPRPSIARVLVVDDHTLLRQGIRSALEEFTDIVVVGEGADGEQAVALSHSLQPHIVIMDINMPGVDGIQATHQLKRELPHVHVIGLSVDCNKEAEKAMRTAGAVAFLSKDTAVETIHETIVQVLQSAFDIGVPAK